MSYDEKLLREFVRRSLREVVMGSEGGAHLAGTTRWGEDKIKPPGFKDRWCYGRSADTCMRAKGIWGLLGFTEALPQAWGAVFSEYKCAGGASDGTEFGSCKGVFPSLWDAVSIAGRRFLDILFNVSKPTVNQSAKRFGENFFPHTREWVRSGGKSTIPGAPVAVVPRTEPTLWNISGPGEAIPPEAITEFRTLFEMSLLLEQDEVAAEGLEEAVRLDLDGVLRLVNNITSSSDIFGAVSEWFDTMGEGGKGEKLRELASAMEGLSDGDFGSDGKSGLVKVFGQSIVKPFISHLLRDMRDKIINLGLSPNTESAIKFAFDSTIAAMG